MPVELLIDHSGHFENIHVGNGSVMEIWFFKKMVNLIKKPIKVEVNLV